MEKKKKILSKFKDYTNELELALEGKNIDGEAKNLILSIYYKLDNFYKDYTLVKADCASRNKYIENLISIIKNKCKTIKIISPNDTDEKDKYMIDNKNGEIRCLPIENILLFSIFKLNENYVVDSKYKLNDLKNNCFNYVVHMGSALNHTEPIRDFTGWSWNVQIDEEKNIYYNFVFQNLLMLFGYDFVLENLKKADFRKILKDKISICGYGKSGNDFVQTLIELSIMLYNNDSKEFHDICLKYKKSLINKRNMLNIRKEYVEDKAKNNADINKQIKKYDEMLENIELLRKEYNEAIKKDKDRYLGLSDFVDYIDSEKDNLQKKISSNNKLLSSEEYLNKHDDYKNELDLFESINEEKEKVNIQSKMLDLQKSFLECFNIKIVKAETKKDLYNIARELRYYANILYKTNKTVLSEKKLLTQFENTEKLLINRMIQEKVIELGFTSQNLNYEISKYIFNTKIIKLDNIVLKVKFINDGEIEVEYYDDKVLEHTANFKLPLDEDIANKKDRKIKLLKIGG